MSVALVTGGSAGLGLALVRGLARARAGTVVTDGRATEPSLRRAGGRGGARSSAATSPTTDTGQPLRPRSTRLGRLDLLVHNASTLGPLPMRPLARGRPRRPVRDVWRTNIGAPLVLTGSLLAAAAGGRAACWSRSARTRRVEHYETWGAVRRHQGRARPRDPDLGPPRTGLTGYAVDPGDMRTAMHQDAFPGEDISDRPLPRDRRAAPAGAARRSGRSRGATALPTCGGGLGMTHPRRDPAHRVSPPSEPSRRDRPRARGLGARRGAGCWSATPGRHRRTPVPRPARPPPRRRRAGRQQLRHRRRRARRRPDAPRRSSCTSRTALDDGDAGGRAPHGARRGAGGARRRAGSRGRRRRRRRSPARAVARAAASSPDGAGQPAVAGRRCAATSTALLGRARPPDRLRLPRPSLPARAPTRRVFATGPAAPRWPSAGAAVHAASSSPGSVPRRRGRAGHAAHRRLVAGGRGGAQAGVVRGDRRRPRGMVNAGARPAAGGWSRSGPRVDPGALESAVDARRPSRRRGRRGWTDRVVTPDAPAPGGGRPRHRLARPRWPRTSCWSRRSPGRAPHAGGVRRCGRRGLPLARVRRLGPAAAHRRDPTDRIPDRRRGAGRYAGVTGSREAVSEGFPARNMRKPRGQHGLPRLWGTTEGVSMTHQRKTLVVAGHGMVGHRFVQAAIERGLTETYDICGGGRGAAAGVRPGGAHLLLRRRERRRALAAPRRRVRRPAGAAASWPPRSPASTRRPGRWPSRDGRDAGATTRWCWPPAPRPFVPPVPGRDLDGCFVYRTIEDLEAIREASRTATRGVVIGGGLLGLEAANALVQLGLETHVVEMAPRLMPVQLDEAAGRRWCGTSRSWACTVHAGARPPRRSSARTAGGRAGAGGRGPASRPRSWSSPPASGPATSWPATPGSRSPSAAASWSTSSAAPPTRTSSRSASAPPPAGGCTAWSPPATRWPRSSSTPCSAGPGTFTGADMSTKLKLLGVDVAQLRRRVRHHRGRARAGLRRRGRRASTRSSWSPTTTARRLLGGILVGDASAYGVLRPMVSSGIALPANPEELILPAARRRRSQLGLPDEAQVCSCNNVTKARDRRRGRAEEQATPARTCLRQGVHEGRQHLRLAACRWSRTSSRSTSPRSARSSTRACASTSR